MVYDFSRHPNDQGILSKIVQLPLSWSLVLADLLVPDESKKTIPEIATVMYLIFCNITLYSVLFHFFSKFLASLRKTKSNSMPPPPPHF